MSHIKKISSTLSVAATVLLEACSSSGSDSGSAPAAVANTAAPQLVASWQSDCIVTQNSSSSSTTTQASGGGGGTGGVSGGEAYRVTAIFSQQGQLEFSTEYFATANCNANTLSGFGHYEAVYFIGEAGLANDGSPVTEFSYSDASSTSYSIFQVVNDSSLYLGDEEASSPGKNGRSEMARFDGLGPRLSRQ